MGQKVFPSGKVSSDSCWLAGLIVTNELSDNYDPTVHSPVQFIITIERNKEVTRGRAHGGVTKSNDEFEDRS